MKAHIPAIENARKLDRENTPLSSTPTQEVSSAQPDQN